MTDLLVDVDEETISQWREALGVTVLEQQVNDLMLVSNQLLEYIHRVDRRIRKLAGEPVVTVEVQGQAGPDNLHVTYLRHEPTNVPKPPANGKS